MIERKAGERLAGKDAGEPPGVEPRLEAGLLRGADNIAHRVPVVGEVCLRKAVDDVGAAMVEHVLEVGADVAEGARGEVRDAGFHADGSIADRFRWKLNRTSHIILAL